MDKDETSKLIFFSGTSFPPCTWLWIGILAGSLDCQSERGTGYTSYHGRCASICNQGRCARGATGRIVVLRRCDPEWWDGIADAGKWAVYCGGIMAHDRIDEICRVQRINWNKRGGVLSKIVYKAR